MGFRGQFGEAFDRRDIGGRFCSYLGSRLPLEDGH